MQKLYDMVYLLLLLFIYFMLLVPWTLNEVSYFIQTKWKEEFAEYITTTKDSTNKLKKNTNQPPATRWKKPVSKQKNARKKISKPFHILCLRSTHLYTYPSKAAVQYETFAIISMFFCSRSGVPHLNSLSFSLSLWWCCNVMLSFR